MTLAEAEALVAEDWVAAALAAVPDEIDVTIRIGDHRSRQRVTRAELIDPQVMQGILDSALVVLHDAAPVEGFPTRRDRLARAFQIVAGGKPK